MSGDRLQLLTLRTACLVASALSVSALAAAAVSTVDGGGQRTASANYTMDGSVGGIGAASAGGGIALKSGYIGQLTEVTNLTVTAVPATVNEGGTNQLSGLAGLDDATVVALAGTDVVWSACVYPVAAIGPDGHAIMANVYADASGTVTGRYLNVAGSAVVFVLNSNPDNFGLYAGDQIPDDWQVQYFGTENSNGCASATNATGQNNLYAYIADLCPTNPSSSFEIVAVSNQVPDRIVCFGMTSADRQYRLLYTTNLVDGVWTNLPGTGWASGVSGQMSLSDTNAAALRYYRVHVQVPQ